jgi:hypothetical protein
MALVAGALCAAELTKAKKTLTEPVCGLSNPVAAGHVAPDSCNGGPSPAG